MVSLVSDVSGSPGQLILCWVSRRDEVTQTWSIISIWNYGLQIVRILPADRLTKRRDNTEFYLEHGEDD